MAHLKILFPCFIAVLWAWKQNAIIHSPADLAEFAEKNNKNTHVSMKVLTALLRCKAYIFTYKQAYR